MIKLDDTVMENQLATLPTNYNFLDLNSTRVRESVDDQCVLNEEISRLFEEVMPNGVIAVNDAGIILSFNKKAEEIFGRSAQETIGKNIGDIILLEYPDKLDSCIVNFVKTKSEVKFLDRLCEISEKYGDGSIIPVRFSVGKIHLDDRLLVSITVQGIEGEKFTARQEKRIVEKLLEMDLLLVTETASLEDYKIMLRKEREQRKRAENKLRLSQAMSSIDARFVKAGRVAEQIAHDFQNLLVPLQTFPKFLKDKVDGNSEWSEHCSTIEQVTHRLMQINNQLLALMTLDRQNAVRFDINMILTEAINLVNDYFQGEFIITNKVSDDRYIVEGRPEQLYRVFFNLLLNAKDALYETNGNVVVKCERIMMNYPERTQNDHDLKREYAKIMIGDDGHGIARENLSKIFEPFFSTKNTTKQNGTGLGLTIVRDIVKDHDGHIEVESVEGKGAVFSIQLPIQSTE